MKKSNNYKKTFMKEIKDEGVFEEGIQFARDAFETDTKVYRLNQRGFNVIVEKVPLQGVLTIDGRDYNCSNIYEVGSIRLLQKLGTMFDTQNERIVQAIWEVYNDETKDTDYETIYIPKSKITMVRALKGGFNKLIVTKK